MVGEGQGLQFRGAALSLEREGVSCILIHDKAFTLQCSAASGTLMPSTGVFSKLWNHCDALCLWPMKTNKQILTSESKTSRNDSASDDLLLPVHLTHESTAKRGVSCFVLQD